MTEQPVLFTTPAEDRRFGVERERAAAFELVRVPGGFQCPCCGQVEAGEALLDQNHGYPNAWPFGTWCYRLMLRRNHARYALRCGDMEFWARATADLREIAAWRAGRRT